MRTGEQNLGIQNVLYLFQS